MCRMAFAKKLYLDKVSHLRLMNIQKPNLFSVLGFQTELQHGFSPSTKADRLSSGGIFPLEALCCCQEKDQRRV